MYICWGDPMELSRFARFFYQPVRPLGKNRSFVTCSNAHWALAKQAATEGTVLLKNDGTLPLEKGSRVCLFGIGAGEFLFGGGGSAEVFPDREITLAQGLQAAADRGEIRFFPDTVEFYVNRTEAIQRADFETQTAGPVVWRRNFHMPLPVLPEELYEKAKAFGGTAVFCLSRFSSEGDDSGDRNGQKGDFYLWDEEQALLDRLYRDFEKVVVVIVSCGPVSTCEYEKANAVLYPMYGGGIAGEAITDILLGKTYPSGHLQHTFAKSLADYPTTAEFHKEKDYVNYEEDIFVGYRYFETFAPEKVAYPFGFGLGYTTFDIKTEAVLEKFTVKLAVTVTNTGNFAGKEVVQAYLTAPQGVLGKAAKVLTAFAKTKELKLGEAQKLSVHFDIREFGSFDDLGKILESAFVLEKGNYIVSVGSNVRDTEKVLEFALAENIICKKCHPYMAPKALPRRLCADGSYEKLPQPPQIPHPIRKSRVKAEMPETEFSLADALAKDRLEEFIATLDTKDMAELLYGHPMQNVSLTGGIGVPTRYGSKDKKKLPLVPTTDGPMGVRARPDRGVLTTFFPCETAVAQTWNLKLAKKLGAALGKETKENNMGIWLAPGVNIHRNPLGGRNFEYYSEDPLTSGLFGVNVVMGVQSQKIVATVKHYCCNNRENGRRVCDSRVSQRALREIYLRSFEIVVKKGKPWALMTAYNPVNGVYSSANWEAINGVLRGEWGFDGVVMTDWWTIPKLEEELHAGGDVKMPESGDGAYTADPAATDPVMLMETGRLDEGAALLSVRRILNMMAKLD